LCPFGEFSLCFQEHGRTPLHWACRCDKIDIIEYLFSKDADINATDNVCEFPLSFRRSLVFTVSFCLQDGNTPLHYVAAFTNTPSMILTLLDMDVIYDALNHANETPADMARRCGKALHARMLDLYKPVPGALLNVY
jgi:Ankyrin repeat